MAKIVIAFVAGAVFSMITPLAGAFRSSSSKEVRPNRELEQYMEQLPNLPAPRDQFLFEQLETRRV